MTDRRTSHDREAETERSALAAIEAIAEKGAADIARGAFRTIATTEDRRTLLEHLLRRR